MRKRRSRAQAKPDAVAADRAKAHVMAYFRELVAGGFAEWHTLEDGTIRLRLNTGDVYLLKKAAIRRIA